MQKFFIKRALGILCLTCGSSYSMQQETKTLMVLQTTQTNNYGTCDIMSHAETYYYTDLESQSTCSGTDLFDRTLSSEICSDNIRQGCCAGVFMTLLGSIWLCALFC